MNENKDDRAIHEIIGEWCGEGTIGVMRQKIVEYVATARKEAQIATLRHAIEVADELEYELPQFQHMQGAEAVRKRLQAELAALERAATTED